MIIRSNINAYSLCFLVVDDLGPLDAIQHSLCQGNSNAAKQKQVELWLNTVANHYMTDTVSVSSGVYFTVVFS